jgi:hypothetical protein
MEDAVRELGGSRVHHQYPSSQHDFPLQADSQSTLERDIFAELRVSWAVHRELSTRLDELSTSDLSTQIARLQGCTSHSRQAIEDHIQQTLNNETVQAMPSGLDLKRLSRVHSRATARDLLLSALHPEIMSEFNPSITEDDQRKLHEFIIEWLRLCVIEDKLVRLYQLSNDEQGLQRELHVFRSWDPCECPAWLVFEVENSLQIWPEQAAVAKRLINFSSSIVQLNMGMGKTR